jgi:hypothetical protein
MTGVYSGTIQVGPVERAYGQPGERPRSAAYPCTFGDGSGWTNSQDASNATIVHAFTAALDSRVLGDAHGTPAVMTEKGRKLRAFRRTAQD